MPVSWICSWRGWSRRDLLKSGGRQRTDSTHIIAAVRQLNQVELVGETVRACVEALAVADPDWVSARLDAGWQRRYGARVDSWRMPGSKTKRAALGADHARDGVALLAAVWDTADAAVAGAATGGRGPATGPDPERGDRGRPGWAGGDSFAGGRHGRAPAR